MQNDSRSTAGVLTAACALLLLGVASGCTEARSPTAVRPAADEAALSTSGVCDGTYNCELPDPNPCAVEGVGGLGRLAHPNDPGDCTFSIKPQTVLYSGSGLPIGIITDAEVAVDFGQRKPLPSARVDPGGGLPRGNGGAPEPAVFVPDATTTEGVASGWVRESSFRESLSFMPTVNAADPGQGDYPRTWTITGGAAQLRAYYDQMVLCADERPCAPAPNHYLLRPGGVVNIIYSLPGMGGVSNDTYLVDGAAVHFRRARGVPLLSIPYYDKDSPAGSSPVGQMQFMYGHVGDRYGWVAVEALSGSPTNAP